MMEILRLLEASARDMTAGPREGIGASSVRDTLSAVDRRGTSAAAVLGAVALAALLGLAACAPAEVRPSATPSGALRTTTTEQPSPSDASSLIATLPGEPTVSLYLPYLAKTLGGVDGWETPFIIQNTDTTTTDLELNFYAIADGRLVTRRIVRDLKPGTSYADRPNRDSDLQGDAAYSAIVRSFGAKAVAVVNQQRGTGSRFEADSYVSQIGGAPSVFLPSVARRVDGFISRIVVQNVDLQPTVASAVFASLDGASSATLTRTIQPGRSSVIDLGAERDLVDGTRYAVRISAAARLVAIVNSERDVPAQGGPVLYSYGSLTSGANTVYAPYVVKNVPGAGAGDSIITVQNMGTAAAQPSLSFTPLGGGVSTRIDGPSLAPGAGWLVDPRFRNGDAKQLRCGAGSSAGCLGDGEYSLTAAAPLAQLATVVTVIGPTTAAAYTALTRPADFFLPNVTRTLGGRDGWTTPIIVQSVTASRLTLTWYRFTDGLPATTQALTITPGSALRVDPRNVAGLSDDAQYSVLVDGNGGRLVAVVVQLNFGGGDGAAIYAGFFR
jgi:hypothetical protein